MLQKETELSIVLKEFQLEKKDFIMYFPVKKVASWNPKEQESCMMYLTL